MRVEAGESHSKTDCCIESKGTTTSETSPGSQYAASSRIITSPLTPFRDCSCCYFCTDRGAGEWQATGCSLTTFILVKRVREGGGCASQSPDCVKEKLTLANHGYWVYYSSIVSAILSDGFKLRNFKKVFSSRRPLTTIVRFSI